MKKTIKREFNKNGEILKYNPYKIQIVEISEYGNIKHQLDFNVLTEAELAIFEHYLQGMSKIFEKVCIRQKNNINTNSERCDNIYTKPSYCDEIPEEKMDEYCEMMAKAYEDYVNGKLKL